MSKSRKNLAIRVDEVGTVTAGRRKKEKRVADNRYADFSRANEHDPSTIVPDEAGIAAYRPLDRSRRRPGTWRG